MKSADLNDNNQSSVIHGRSCAASTGLQTQRNADRNSKPGDNPFFSRKWRHAIGRN